MAKTNPISVRFDKDYLDELLSFGYYDKGKESELVHKLMKDKLTELRNNKKESNGIINRLDEIKSILLNSKNIISPTQSTPTNVNKSILVDDSKCLNIAYFQKEMDNLDKDDRNKILELKSEAESSILLTQIQKRNILLSLQNGTY